MKMGRLWGGRFEASPSEEIIGFLSGRDVRGVPPSDERLIPYDLWGSRAHVLMLCHGGLLSKPEGKKILRGLREIERLHQQGAFRLDPAKEDVHSNVESFLIRRLGIDVGGKVHTGRSRNDQVCLDMRLYLRHEALAYVGGLLDLLAVLLRRADEHRSAIMPGYTHHQRATATTFGHLLLSFAEALERDVRRFWHWWSLFNQNPLGAMAGYGTLFPLDRRLTSKLLGFDSPTENVLDPITQRWEPEAELACAVAVMMDHLSTMAQTLILLSTEEFGMVQLDDRHCSGSSIMPQKRNPDTLEVIKAKTAFAHGTLVSLLTTGKSLFMGYNRDTQWTKYWVMDLIDESMPALPVMTEVIRLLHVHRGRMLELAEKGFVGATSLMEWMVQRRGLAVRKAKAVIERAVKYSGKEGKGKISYEAYLKALQEMKIDGPVSRRDVERFQKPEHVLSRIVAAGTPSERGFQGNKASLELRRKAHQKEWARRGKAIEQSRNRTARMEQPWTR